MKHLHIAIKNIYSIWNLSIMRNFHIQLILKWDSTRLHKEYKENQITISGTRTL